ncbi:glycosyltransferase family 4 protein [Alkaliphilus sp. B6464]|uniref:glycosyltransferase family 4 protein n=1 Tax=Alkaliphilus sp. B6464 TaxID=2731219 RepID=UPI001BAD56AB|nr:MraY family glycosyltransferase [Alkaliphilus sp. B6464]QUH19100.1 undecaprenyl/decaprenyl-phosphate alpha-N-acetylglucosaminyl 1-phosphate transferase [Alkaliphilus sp. B6464]
MEKQNIILAASAAFVIALVISYLLTPYAKKLAYKIGAIDIPKDNRRVHKEPMPRLGGIAIYSAFVITAIVMAVFNPNMHLNSEFKGILIGVTIIVMIGIVDDVKQISAKYKLAAQIVAALIVVYSGVTIDFINFPLVKSESGYVFLKALKIPMTIFWIVGITNTVNLIDGLDGLAAGVSAIASLSLAAVAYNIGQYNVAILLAILAGASSGFLPYNFNPAQIFMGDTGSLAIGFLLATISVEGVIKKAATIAVAIPVLALGVPIFDTTFAIIRRLLNGRPIMEADKGHLHHRLLDHGFSQKQTVITLYAISMVLGGSAVVVSNATSRISAYLVIAAISLLVLFGALRMGLMKKVEERKAKV